MIDRELALALLWRISPRLLRALRDRVDLGELPFPWSAADLSSLRARIPAGALAELLQLPSPADLERTRRIMAAAGVEFLTSRCAGFPEELASIPDPPPFLFTRGRPLPSPASQAGESRPSPAHPPQSRPRVAVIGSRAASAAGREIAYGLGRDLALAGVEVVSGMARGIDAEAHRGALDAGGRTIAVLGTGADVCYPPEHAELLGRILSHGGVVTEFPPGVPGLRLHFPRRNRILTGLARVLVVVEGGERSGARSSVEHALDQGREVLASPRDVLHPGSALPNRLLRDGARPVLGVRDVLEALGSAIPTADAMPADREHPAADQPTLTPLEARLLEALRRRRCDLAGCRRAVPTTPTGELVSALSRLEVMGWITRLPGGRYAAVEAKGIFA